MAAQSCTGYSPFRTAVPFRGQNTWNYSGVLSQWQRSPKRAKKPGQSEIFWRKLAPRIVAHLAWSKVMLSSRGARMVEGVFQGGRRAVPRLTPSNGRFRGPVGRSSAAVSPVRLQGCRFDNHALRVRRRVYIYIYIYIFFLSVAFCLSSL